MFKLFDHEVALFKMHASQRYSWLASGVRKRRGPVLSQLI
jgi:hypothetical protein